ncbi:P-loop containing nucleoside triphosphate hydrolase protein, partial [Ochromonadaceae sp. CCMP2298]
MRKALQLVCCLFGLVALGLYIYVVSVHRLRGLGDVRAVLNTIALPKTSPRCRRFNETHLRCLPNVMLIGQSKCGTTSLVTYLKSLPDVHFVSRRVYKVDTNHSAVHRFDRNTFPFAWTALDLADEWASSPLVPSENSVVIHDTPHYFYAPTVPFDVARFYPHAQEMQFIVMLREPVPRAWSSYWFKKSYMFSGSDQGSAAEFMDLARSEMQTRRKYESCMRQKRGYGRPSSGGLFESVLNCSTTGGTQHCTAAVQSRALLRAIKICFGAHLRSAQLGLRHLDKSIYIDQLLRWFSLFDPRRFHFLSLENFAQNPQKEFGSLLTFLHNSTAGINAQVA